MGNEELGERFDSDGRYPRLERVLKKDHIQSDRLFCIGKNAVSRRCHGRCLRLSVSESEVISNIKRCLTEEQRERIRKNQEVPVVGYDEEGERRELMLREEKKIHSSYIFELEMTSKSGWEKWEKEGISIWGFPYGGSGDDATVFIVFTPN